MTHGHAGGAKSRLLSVLLLLAALALEGRGLNLSKAAASPNQFKEVSCSSFRGAPINRGATVAAVCDRRVGAHRAPLQIAKWSFHAGVKALPFLAQPARFVRQDSGPDRDAWQHPAEVTDALGLRPGNVVADVGCGSGYFTFHLAARVGPQGRVYAVDIDDKELAKIRRRAAKESLTQIEAILGARDNPRLSAESADAVLVVNAYHEMRDYDAMLQGLYRALKPGGLLGMIEGADHSGQPRSTYYERHRMPEELVREDASGNGFRFLRNERTFIRPDDKKEFYFLIFEKPKPQ